MHNILLVDTIRIIIKYLKIFKIAPTCFRLQEIHHQGAWLAKHCLKPPDDGSLVIRNILNIFKYFVIILIVSTNYIFARLLDNNRH